jgi:drug/metabolite transporter (DMT)-like permease
MGILLGLVAALCWGISDFSARFVSRRIGTYRTMFFMQGLGFCILTICMRPLNGWGHLADGSGWRPWAWGGLAGCCNMVATLALYRSFEIGKLAIVAPISASYPALTVLLAMASGETLTIWRGVGITATIAGVILLSFGNPAEAETCTGVNPGQLAEIAPQQTGNWPRGVASAIVSALGFGVLFWLLGIRVVPRVGSTAAVWMIRLTSFSVIGLLAAPLRQSLNPPLGRTWWILLMMAVLDTGAFVANNFGDTTEQVAVVSVLVSLYAAVTVALAAVFLRERITRWQWPGIVLIFAGIALISR